ncbi:hypothetical protein JOB18_039375 [Solea senegalensis]|uniref:Uncharacterized protein n=2 Tax=Solea senegalensis TaxID=28829 RepID=A0AAV6Q2B9_SOLSE|nr:hypothetical protein JOB18_039375 [Solea senegalensis]
MHTYMQRAERSSLVRDHEPLQSFTMLAPPPQLPHMGLHALGLDHVSRQSDPGIVASEKLQGSDVSLHPDGTFIDKRCFLKRGPSRVQDVLRHRDHTWINVVYLCCRLVFGRTHSEAIIYIVPIMNIFGTCGSRE